MNIKIDFNRGFIIPDGTSSPEIGQQNKILSNFLAALTVGEPVKLWGWAVELSKSGILEIDEADRTMLLGLVQNTTNLIVLAKVQLMQTIKDAGADKTPARRPGA